jgi:cell division protein FtsI/penicillin-binding protein 2
MKKTIVLLVLLSFILSACSQPTANATSTATVAATFTLPPPAVRTTSTPDAEISAQAFLDAWKNEDYSSMYGMLSESSRKAILEEAFTKAYKDVAAVAALNGVDYSIEPIQSESDKTQIPYHLTLHSNVVGDIQADTAMTLQLENGQWRIEWDKSLILPQLANGGTLKMDLTIPERAAIYDRYGKALASKANATAVGFYPDSLNPDRIDRVLSGLAQLTGLKVENITGMFQNAPPGTVGYLPLSEVPTDLVTQHYSWLQGADGVVLQDYTARFYPDGGVGPHVVGYVSTIHKEELQDYLKQGYLGDERVGRAGLEKWGEEYLAGKRGGTLYAYDAQGNLGAKLGEVVPQPSQPITTTLDYDLQLGVQQAINGFRGAAVVIERDTGRVLAMASSPGFDPNAYEITNYNFQSLISQIGNNPDSPGFDRAAQGQYPLGSTFKVITMAAALEKGGFTPQTTYECGYDFTELQGITLHDWTWEHFQNDGVTQPSGLLTLPQGLIRSCDPFFWHLGLDMYNRGLTTAVSDMARSFGLGSPTGILGIPEEAGKIPDPASQLDATNLAIGQGDMLVTPLQVATFMAAIGNGGTLYKPQIIERIGAPGSSPIMEFSPQVRNKLPVSQENLKLIKDAMRGVTTSKKPLGTAFYTFNGFNVPVYGKTGTAQSGSGEPHAWFAGYTDAGNPDKPDIAIAVILENAGEGSDYAAPVFRRIVEDYFQGHPLKRYRWESTIGVTATPTEPVTETPTPEGQ